MSKMNTSEVPESITLCDDGKYRWVYELKMMKNPAIFFTVFKVLAISSFVPALVVLIADGFKNVLGTLKVYALILVIMFVLCLIGYAITAWMYKGKYCVIFTMDDEGILHAQQEKQFEKAQLMGFITAMAGAAANNPQAAGAGLLAASKSELYSKFQSVKKIRVYKNMNLIKLDYPTSHNQVYCENDALEFVEQFIKERCPNAK